MTISIDKTWTDGSDDKLTITNDFSGSPLQVSSVVCEGLDRSMIVNFKTTVGSPIVTLD